MFKFLLLLVITIQRILSQADPDDLIIIITLNDGVIRGTNYLTPNNKTYYGYRGIPYATPPLGNLRFEAPQPPEPWDVRDAFNDSKSCITKNYLNDPDNESEDCLYINVYTPVLRVNTKEDEGLPVLFWIYGGAFTDGSSTKSFYGPDFLVEEDVILVTFNYRLGTAGFLSTGDTAIRGNAGLKDQNMALKWTYDNIESFGGDPSKITIFGQSAGAYSVGYHLISEKSAGLFRGGILESGSVVGTLAIHMDPRSYAFLLADAIPGGNYGNDTQLLKEYLLNRTVDELIRAANSLPPDQQALAVIEVQGEDAFLTESPYELLETGRFSQVPVIIGICAEESLWFLKDNLITRGAIKHAELSSNFVPVYLYQFSYYGRPITVPFINGTEKATHLAELPFIFYVPGLIDTNDADLLTQNRMIKLWTNFAKYLNPTPDTTELFNNITWSAVNPTNQTYLNINGTLELHSNLRSKAYPQWSAIFETYGRKPFITF